MSLITLTTDFGTKDHFVGAVKGAILSELSDVKIIDITHEISPFNITETAYILTNSYKSFPDKTIHIVGVDSELSADNKHIALELDNHYFVCPDNGIISMIAAEIKPTKIVEINIHDRIESSFPVLDVFVQVACFIARGGNLTVIGKEIQTFKKMINSCKSWLKNMSANIKKHKKCKVCISSPSSNSRWQYKVSRNRAFINQGYQAPRNSLQNQGLLLLVLRNKLLAI